MLRRFLSTTPRAVSRNALSRSRTQPQQPLNQSYDFTVESDRLFRALEKALEPLLVVNPGSNLAASSTELTLDLGAKGAYIFSKDADRRSVNLQSPVSGLFAYSFDAGRGLWLSQADGHDMRGLVTRDVLRHCVGCPQF
jgi:frataxin-like iron-binding protein CyaY